MAELELDSSGARLRRAREEAGLHRSDIAARTKIPERLIAALEDGNFAALPARAYAVGFSRSFARIVGLDEGEIARAVRAEINGVRGEDSAGSPPAFEPGDPARVPGSGLAWLTALAAVVVALGVLVFWRSYYSPGMTLPSLAPSETPAQSATAPVPAIAAVTAAPISGPVVFTATAPDVWVKFYDASGTQLLQKQLALGESYTVPDTAQGPMIWTARPEVLSITIGGQPVPPLAGKQVTLKDVPVTAAALLARGAAIPAQTVPAPTSAPQPRPARPRPQASVPAAPVPVAQATLAASPAPPAAQPSTVSN